MEVTREELCYGDSCGQCAECLADGQARLRLLARTGAEDGIFPSYAWPGAYALAYIADDGDEMCADCVNTESGIHFAGDGDGWRIDGFTSADWHDLGESDWICAHCNRVISEATEDR